MSQYRRILIGQIKVWLAYWNRKKMKLKNTRKLAIELATNLSENRLKLHGNSEVNGVIDNVHVGETNIENTFLFVYGVETKFFYSASILCKNKFSFSEVGIGHIELDGASPILHRDECLYHQTEDGVNNSRRFSPLDCKHSDEKIIISSYYPTSIHEILYSDNCVLTSIDSHVPSATKLDKNSLLLRLDGDIESLSFAELKNVDELSSAVKDLLCKYTKQIVMNTSKLDVKTVGVEHLIIKSSSKPISKKGEIYYDEKENALKFFDGKNWKYFFR